MEIPLHVCPAGTRVILKAHYVGDSHSAVQFLLIDEETCTTPVGRHQVFLWDGREDFAGDGCALEPTCSYGEPSENAVSTWVDFGERRFLWHYDREEQVRTTLSLSPTHMQNILRNPYHDLDSKDQHAQPVWDDRTEILAAQPQCLALVARCAPIFAARLDPEQYRIDSEALALDLLAPEVGDYGLRSSAVAFFGGLSDARLSFFLPQLVALLRHEARPLTCPLLRMLLERGLKNPAKIGSVFYWLLFPKDPSTEYVFAQIREAYKARISPCERRLIIEQEAFFMSMRNLQEVNTLCVAVFCPLFSFFLERAQNSQSI